jgi:hypothetical protein
MSRLFQDIDYEGFRLFVDTFLEVETPEELCRHLFLSFVKRHEARPQAVDGKAMKVSSRNRYTIMARHIRRAHKIHIKLCDYSSYLLELQPPAWFHIQLGGPGNILPLACVLSTAVGQKWFVTNSQS